MKKHDDRCNSCANNLDTGNGYNDGNVRNNGNYSVNDIRNNNPSNKDAMDSSMKDNNHISRANAIPRMTVYKYTRQQAMTELQHRWFW